MSPRPFALALVALVAACGPLVQVGGGGKPPGSLFVLRAPPPPPPGNVAPRATVLVEQPTVVGTLQTLRVPVIEADTRVTYLARRDLGGAAVQAVPAAADRHARRASGHRRAFGRAARRAGRAAAVGHADRVRARSARGQPAGAAALRRGADRPQPRAHRRAALRGDPPGRQRRSRCGRRRAERGRQRDGGRSGRLDNTLILTAAVTRALARCNVPFWRFGSFFLQANRSPGVK